MDASFWHAKWEKGEIGFHLDEVNPLLVDYLGALNLPLGSRIFLPLCGKTRDIPWLLAAGYQVVGAELSRLAIEQLFADLGVTPSVVESAGQVRFSADGLDVVCGDIFELSAAELGRVDAIYDRAALVALPEPQRSRYAQHLVEISAGARQLLIAYDYDQTSQNGPPFSVNPEQVRRLYSQRYTLHLLASVDVAGGLRGKCPATEHVWRLESLSVA